MARRTPVQPPPPHPSGARPPEIPPELVPRHVAIVMDGNGRWAKQRGLPRDQGSRGRRGGAARTSSTAPSRSASTPSAAYAFSTENWKRSPTRCASSWASTARSSGAGATSWTPWACGCAGPAGDGGSGAVSSTSSRRPSAVRPATHASPCSSASTTAAGPRSPTRPRRSPATSRPAGWTRPRSTSAPSPATSTSPACPTSTCSCGPPASSARRTSCSGSRPTPRLVFLDVLWPDVDRRHLWQAIETYARRDRRYGGAEG